MNKGENNPNAVLTDDEVELMRTLRDSERGVPRAKRVWTQAKLAEKFDISVRHVKNILSYRQR